VVSLIATDTAAPTSAASSRSRPLNCGFLVSGAKGGMPIVDAYDTRWLSTSVCGSESRCRVAFSISARRWLSRNDSTVTCSCARPAMMSTHRCCKHPHPHTRRASLPIVVELQ
jgi:hypothetical protein